MLRLLCVSMLAIITHHVWAQEDIFHLTSEVFGLAEEDFVEARDQKALFRQMSPENREKYMELKGKGGKPFQFIVQLWVNAWTVAKSGIVKAEAYRRVSLLYKEMTDQDKESLQSYFPKVKNAFATSQRSGKEHCSIKVTGDPMEPKKRLSKIKDKLNKFKIAAETQNWTSAIEALLKKDPEEWNIDDLYSIVVHLSDFLSKAICVPD